MFISFISHQRRVNEVMSLKEESGVSEASDEGDWVHSGARH